MTDGIDPGRSRIVAVIGVITVVAVIGIAMAAAICVLVPERHGPGGGGTTHFAMADNGTAYTVTYIPHGDESAVWIEPMIAASGFDTATRIPLRGIVRAAPTNPVVYTGDPGDDCQLVQVRIERDGRIETRYVEVLPRFGGGVVP